MRPRLPYSVAVAVAVALSHGRSHYKHCVESGGEAPQCSGKLDHVCLSRRPQSV